MKNKRLLLTFLTLFAFYAVTFAVPISEETAREKAARFMLSKKEGTSSARSAQRFDGSSYGATLTSVEHQEAYYVFNIDSVNGYVIVSGDDRMPDVLGYAYHGTYKPEEIPENMRAWLQEYVEEYQYLQSHSDAKGASLTSVTGDAVLPLLDCTWNQTFPYNNLCPKINSKTTYTGCVATAMAQVMYYHKWPKQTTKAIPAYTTKSAGIYMPQIEITTIDWDNMVPSYGYNGGTSVQNQAVAKLMLLCGCAVEMNYGLDGSAAYCNPNALTEYFGYNKLSVSEVRRSSYSSNTWNQMIYDEVKEGRPVLYSGESYDSGHQFVIDGYDNNDYFHVNWGWGGSQDNYFLLSSLNGYNSSQRAIIGIEGQGTVNHKYAYAELDGETLTFYYDNKRETRTGTMFNVNNHEWTSDEYKNTITTVKFDSSFDDYKYLVNTGYMFYDMENLTSIQGMEYLNTQNVTSMNSMFSGCDSLTSLNVSHFNTQNVTNMSYMFYNCSNLTSLDVSNFDTQNVTSMNSMFSDCDSLTSLNVSNFDTQNVTDMGWMFYKCSNLTSLDVSNFDTQKVTGMNGMFCNCSNLTSLDLSNFNTQIVTNMSWMFEDCGSLTSLDISNFDTQNVTDMRGMFYGCQNLTSLDVSKFVTQNVISMGSMFSGCDSLTSLEISNFDTQNVTDMGGMFYECQNLTSLDLSNFDTQNVTNMSWMFGNCSSLQDIYPGENWNTQNVTSGDYMFYGCYELIGEKGTQYSYSKSDYTYAHIDGGADNPGYFSTKGYSYPYVVISNDNKTLTFYYGNGREVSGSMRVKAYSYYEYRDWDNVAQSLETVVFDKSFAYCNDITSTSYWFYNCENLTSIQGLRYLNTQNVTSMSYMFYKCGNLTSLDVSHFNTQNVTTMSSMFYNCSNLTSLDVSSFNTQNVTNMSWMFGYCSSLQDIYTGENWSTESVTSGDFMFYGCSKLIGEKGTQYSYSSYSNANYTYAHIDGGADYPGYFSTKGYSYPYAVISNDNKTLTFYYGNGKEVSGSMRIKAYSYYSYPDWDSVAQSLETVVFDKSFAYCNDITSTSYWFYNCENLTSIQGLRYLNTQNVTSMSYMFYKCGSLTSLDLNNFDTQNVTDMGWMFYNCSILTSLDVSKFNTQNVTNMNSMFSGCGSLTSLDLSNFNTQNVTNMNSMFYNCRNLTSLDVSNFNTQNVTSIYCMFESCGSLTSLDLSNFNTQNVTSMSYMFCGCYSLQTIYVGKGWNTENVENSIYMFNGCRNLVGQDGTKYNYNYQDKEKAHYDTGGYLTYKAPILRGDVNEDGVVNGTDVQAIINFIVAGEYNETADVNKDNIVNGTDIQEVINIIVNAE
jgi:surface protein